MNHSHDGEQQWSSVLISKISPRMDALGFPISTIRFVENKNSTSLWFRTSMVLRVSIGKNSVLEISEAYKDIVEQFQTGAVLKGGFYQVPISGPLDTPIELILNLIESAYIKSPKDFDCCSRYLECSDAMHCINPRLEYALGCGYRRIMYTGKIFYGENRNIDKS